MTFSRRQLLGTAGAAGAAGLAAAAGGSGWLAGPAASAAAPRAVSPLPDPARSGIEHVVVVMMENRSFDHFLGWLPGADGRQAGLSFVDRYGVRRPTHHLAAYDSCGHADPDHSYEGGRIQLNAGRCDGWLRSGESDELAIGYYTEPDLAFLGPASRDWTTCDRYFSAVMAETYPNRFYMHAARTDRLHNSTAQSTLPTIWDRLAAKGRRGTYYFSDVPFMALWHEKYVGISKPFAQFVADAAAGTLPEVSFVDPSFTGESDGVSSDDHPHADIRAGEHFLNQVYDAVRTGPGWEKTVMVVNYDEWGGFYDHVVPGRAPDVSARTSLRGFRVPALVISPLARRGHVAHDVYDHASVLRMIEWRWGLAPLTPRDAHARNLAEVLDFSRAPQLSSPAYAAPAVLAPGCAADTAVENQEQYAEWGKLREIALKHGWELPA